MNENLRDFVVELSKSTIDEQRDEIKKMCSESPLKAINAAIAALEVIKSSDFVKSNKRLLDLCFSSIDSLQTIVEGRKLTKAAKQDATDNIMAVLVEANRSGIVTKIYDDECLLCLTVLGLISTNL